MCKDEDIASSDALGLELKVGDMQYRAFVGPPRDYDLISAMVFNLLTCLGLRQHHKVLDIGCGSLRCGRLLIPYLNKGNYFGVEPNKWLVDDGVKNEIGQDMVSIKQPSFSYANTLGDYVTKLDLDYVFAQSIFSHCGKDIIEGWFGEVSKHICEKGMFLITFWAGNRDFKHLGWVYPGCVRYKLESMEQMANSAGFSFTTLNWYHPRQTWALLTKGGGGNAFIKDENISWNNLSTK